MPRSDIITREWVKQELDRLGFMGKGVWTEKDCASYRGCSVSLCQKERHFGKGPPFFKMGALVRYHPEDVISFCAEHRITPQTINLGHTHG